MSNTVDASLGAVVQQLGVSVEPKSLERERLERAVIEAVLEESGINFDLSHEGTPEREAAEHAWSTAMDEYDCAVHALRQHLGLPTRRPRIKAIQPTLKAGGEGR